MTSLPQIIGSIQLFLGLEYDPQAHFEESLTDEHRSILAILSVIPEHFFDIPPEWRRRGRPTKYYDACFVKAYIAKIVLRIDTTRDFIKRLQSDRNIRHICGFRDAPSEATFSRFLHRFAQIHKMEQIHSALLDEYLQTGTIQYISRDSTMIPAREKAQNTKREETARVNRKRGRPKKGEQRAQKEESRMKQQIPQKPGKALGKLDRKCTWGCKKNSQGKVQCTKGYKGHFDATEQGIIVTAVVTGANVHDSQAAIPMEKLTARRVPDACRLMDSAYDARVIKEFHTHSGVEVIIDPNKRRNANAARLSAEDAKRYKVRSVVERCNSHIKDWLLPTKIMVKGYKKVNFVIQSAVVVLNIHKIIQHYLIPSG